MDEARWQGLLNRWLDDLLNEDELNEFQHYIEKNSHRKREAEDLKNLVLILQDMPETEVPDDFRATVMQKIQSSENLPTPNAIEIKNKSTAFRYSSVLALAAAVLVFFISMTSILPRVLPGIRSWFSGDIQSETDNGSGLPGITGIEDPAPDCNYGDDERLNDRFIEYVDYDDVEDVGVGKMDAFPRLGPHRSEIDLSADIKVSQKVEVPYFWGSFLVDDMEESLSEVLAVVADQNGVTERTEIIRVNGEDVRVNVTVRILTEGFDDVVAKLFAEGKVHEEEKIMLDRSEEYAAIMQMIQQEQDDIQGMEAELETKEDETEKERLQVDLEIRYGSLSMLEQARNTQLCGIIEFSMIVVR